MTSPVPSAHLDTPITIEIMNGPEDGRVVVCDKTQISIGRATDNTIHLPYDHLISRRHAKIVAFGDSLTLSDLHSTNGTFVGRERVHEGTVLPPNTLFRVGATLLMAKRPAAEASRRKGARPRGR
ncbi:MAG: FHA domain-containing protein [Candidatus Abyssobacteria bacterium SURF_17]|uniref:FHA domain-containing protein n=1 Tax=Candidatus Abyssobacteria bacterium SURF_17 TaxID=2093361 RepID=A0A419F0T0_9BACT|nr:MAG: FHA domain-containing protein [Candidatus Abyssubacteria bacterium SURF_17]